MLCRPRYNCAAAFLKLTISPATVHYRDRIIIRVFQRQAMYRYYNTRDELYASQKPRAPPRDRPAIDSRQDEYCRAREAAAAIVAIWIDSL